jgi:chromosomal replication initiation ATPase DnaA
MNSTTLPAQEIRGQLILDLALRPAMGREDFLVAPPNEAAVAQIDRWPDWGHHAVVLIGPEGCGKSHLAEVFASRSRAKWQSAAGLDEAAVPDLLETGACIIEDIGVNSGLNETALFHLLNLAREQHGHILLTARTAPRTWKIQLNDLATRLAAAPLVRIDGPDDVLLRGLLVKLFADRQLGIDEAVISYMLKNMERSAASARRIVAEIDNAALKNKAEVTRTFIAKLFRTKGASADVEVDESG